MDTKINFQIKDKIRYASLTILWTLRTCGQLFIVLLFISRRLQTQLEAFKTAEAASGKQTKVFIVLFSLF